MNKLNKIIPFLFFASIILASCSDDDDDIFIACTAEPETGVITEVNDMKAILATSIVINATPEQVWEVLTDFDSYPTWSTTFQGLEGNISNGGQVNATFPDGMDGFIAFPHELIYNEGVSFGWSDPLLIAPEIIDNHMYIVESCGSETVFRQSDEFTGNDMASGFTAIGFANFLLMDYQTFNSELKAEVESRF